MLADTGDYEISNETLLKGNFSLAAVGSFANFQILEDEITRKSFLKPILFF